MCRVRLVLYSSSQNAVLVGNFLFFLVIISRSFFYLGCVSGGLFCFDFLSFLCSVGCQLGRTVFNRCVEALLSIVRTAHFYCHSRFFCVFVLVCQLK